MFDCLERIHNSIGIIGNHFAVAGVSRDSGEFCNLIIRSLGMNILLPNVCKG